jgi:hypothetical protein
LPCNPLVHSGEPPTQYLLEKCGATGPAKAPKVNIMMRKSCQPVLLIESSDISSRGGGAERNKVQKSPIAKHEEEHGSVDISHLNLQGEVMKNKVKKTTRSGVPARQQDYLKKNKK